MWSIAVNGNRLTARLSPVLLFADVFQPSHGCAGEPFLNRDVRHGGGVGGAVPVRFTGREPDDVAGEDVFARAAEALSPSSAAGHDQGLAEGVGVPGGAGAGFEGDLGADDTGGVGGLEERVDADNAGEVLRGALGGRLGTAAFDIHA